MSSQPSVEERVIRAIQKIVRNKEVRSESTFEELEVDSLSANEILFEVEDEFDIDMPDEGIRNIRGVADVVHGVERLLAGKAGDFVSGAAGEEATS